MCVGVGVWSCVYRRENGELASPKSAEYADRLSVPARGVVATLSPKAISGCGGGGGEWQNSLLFEESRSCLLKFSTAWIRAIHFIEGNLLCSKYTGK